MKPLSTLIFLFCLVAGNVTGQTTKPAVNSIPPNVADESKPTAAEEREAKQLAAAFFNRFQETQDLAPLIKKFFVRDFARRLKFCDTTNECRGFAKDFWQEKEDFVAVNATDTDYQRLYISAINYGFLYSRSIEYLNENHPQKISYDDKEIFFKRIENELPPVLKDSPKPIKFSLFGVSDDENGFKSKKLDEIRRLLDDNEKYLAALRTVETKLRTEFLKKNPDANISFSPADFTVYAEKNDGFFDYPVGARMIQVWGEGDSIVFIMDLIEEDGKLKIVAVYPPID